MSRRVAVNVAEVKAWRRHRTFFDGAISVMQDVARVAWKQNTVAPQAQIEGGPVAFK
jgi:hypothetical protein